VARFLVAAAEQGVAFKATAGLHHPLRGIQRLTYRPDAPRAAMHGFLNVFAAAALAHSERADAALLVRVLEEEEIDAFHATDAYVAWRDRQIPAAAIESMRQRFALSFGSCSFVEPVEDLQALGWLVT
jgi:hypothetical protein